MQQLIDKQNNLVVKSNQLIQKTRYSLTEKEQKIILYLISRIQPSDTDLRQYTFSLSEFCQICGIDAAGKCGSSYENIKQTIQSLHDKSFWVKEPDGKERLYCWVREAQIDGSQVTIELDPKLKPFLLQLRGSFTQYELEYSLAMRGKYALRLYEILKSYAELGCYDISIAELRSKLMLNKKIYAEFKEFKRNILTKSIDEINTYTDLQIKFQPIRTGRIVTDLHFIIEKKDYWNRVLAIQSRDERLHRD